MADPENERLDSLRTGSLTFPDHAPPSLTNRNIGVLAPHSLPTELPRVENPLPIDPQNFTDPFFASWTSLQVRTQQDPQIPPKALYPSRSSGYQYLEPMTNKRNNQPWELRANWITNPEDPGQKIAVFGRPSPNKGGYYWDVVLQNQLHLVDLIDENDRLALHQNKCKIEFYPPCNDITYQSEPAGITAKCLEEADFFASYQVSDHTTTFTSQTLHYPDWRDGGIIDIETLDLLTQFVLVCPKIGIHCVGGVGRTGTLTTAAFIKNLIVKNRIQKEEFTLEWLSDFILKLRQQRSKDWVANCHQYRLLYEYGLWLFEKHPSTGESSPT